MIVINWRTSCAGVQKIELVVRRQEYWPARAGLREACDIPLRGAGGGAAAGVPGDRRTALELWVRHARPGNGARFGRAVSWSLISQIRS